ncbi:MAG: hypothetical protein AAGC43_07900 [Bacteroidota bacterium]
MKTIQTQVLIVIMVIAATAHVQAQENGMEAASTEEKAEMMTQKQVEVLALNQEQENGMFELNLKYIGEVEQIRSEGRSLATMKILKKMSDRWDKEVKELLTKEQFKAYMVNKEKMREAMRAKHANR